jgi:hypothetical protein
MAGAAWTSSFCIDALLCWLFVAILLRVGCVCLLIAEM